jgi:parvulin-like peptidyl-prolyl isomerase
MKKKLKKPKAPEILKKPFRRAPAPEERLTDALKTVPRITNETVADHREEVLSSARKYIYPLQHSKHSIVRISLGLFAVGVVAFLIGCSLALYKFQSTSGFVYDVTRVLPFPVAKAGSSWVSYESYLFELRRNMHYYHNQQQTDFKSKSGKDQLSRLKKQAMDQVVREAYVKQLAKQNNVSVSAQAVNDEVELVRNQNRLGNNERVFKEVLSEFWGWSEDDFKRELKQELLQQAVVAKLDTRTNDQAREALNQVNSGADFTQVADKMSQDVATKANGGQYPAPITASDRNLAPAVTAEIYRLKKDGISPIINTGYTLEIIKVLDDSGNTRRAAHIQFVFKDISAYTKPIQQNHQPKKYIGV